MDDDLSNLEIGGVDGEAGDFAEIGAFFCFDFEADQMKVEI